MNGEETFTELVIRLWSFPLLTLGGGTLTVALVVKTFAGFVVVWLVALAVRRLVLKRLLRHTALDEGAQFAVRRIAYYLIFIFGLLLVLDTVGLHLSSLAFLGGLIGIGIGFGLQNIASNFISGLILLVERPVKVGDVVTVGDTKGVIRAISIRVTRVLTFDNVMIYVPNSRFIDGMVINWTAEDTRLRVGLDVGVSYGSDPELVRKLLLQIADSDERVLKDPTPAVRFTEFGDSALLFQLLVWIPSIELYADLPSDLRFTIVRVFRENDIEIPFPQRDVHVRPALPPEMTSAQQPSAREA